jgi:FkbM family methyltransferase
MRGGAHVSKVDNLRNFNMAWQAALKKKVKPILFRNEPQLRPLKLGIGRGAVFSIDRRSQLQLEFGLYESELIPHYRRQIFPTAIVYDIGAAEGDTAIKFASLVPFGHVFAFEADETRCQELGQNLDYNPELKGRTEIVNVFVAGQGIYKDPGSGERSRKVSIDDLVDSGEIPPPNFVKIDVDGGELEVLRGMRNTMVSCLHRKSLCLIIEVHSPELELSCMDYLAELGYFVDLVRNAWWRLIWPELRPIGHNRWIIATPLRSSAE